MLQKENPRAIISCVRRQAPLRLGCRQAVPGLVSPEFLESIRNAATQANKEVIGWKDVETVVQPYFSQVLAGGDNPIDFISIVEAMQEAANIAYNNAISKV